MHKPRRRHNEEEVQEMHELMLRMEREEKVGSAILEPMLSKEEEEEFERLMEDNRRMLARMKYVEPIRRMEETDGKNEHFVLEMERGNKEELESKKQEEENLEKTSCEEEKVDKGVKKKGEEKKEETIAYPKGYVDVVDLDNFKFEDYLW